VAAQQHVVNSTSAVLPGRKIVADIKIQNGLEPSDELWRGEFEKALVPIEKWGNGVLVFKLDKVVRARYFLAGLQDTKVARVNDSAQLQLINPGKKATLIYLFATWCGPCWQQMPELNLLHDEYSTKEFDIIGLDVDDESKSDIEKFAQKLHVKFTLAWASAELQARFLKLSRFQGIPQAFLIADGKLVLIATGASPKSTDTVKRTIGEIFKGN
jgi:thiol-disulfide isomerase/thioredoxin